MIYIAARVANDVAYRVLTNEPEITSTTCRKLKEAMNRDLSSAIDGSRVKQCGTTKGNVPVPEVVWPEEAN